MITFVVLGSPIAQGSKIPCKTKAGKLYVRESNATEWKNWRKKVADEAETAGAFTVDILPLDEAIYVHAKFFFKHTQKSKENEVKVTHPDLDKLHRAIGDSLESSGLIKNDARIVGWIAAPGKFYSTQPRVEITVGTMKEFTRKVEGGESVAVTH